MNTFNRTYRSPKFFLCAYHCAKGSITTEPVEECLSQFTFVYYGKGTSYNVDGDEVIVNNIIGDRSLIDVRKYIDYTSFGIYHEDTRIISFNSWKKTDKWEGRLIDRSESTISSNKSYSCIVCFEGTCSINDKDIGELNYANLIQGKEYPINIPQDSYVVLFELC
tara:strand:+ start:579 stop:1073 length:495 start_codon:yes stop_codon:yes gene_type:complete